MKRWNFNLIIGGCIICLVILACTINIGGPAYPTRAIPVSTEAIGELQATINSAITSSGNSGQLTLEISETQLTSYLAYWLSTQSQPILVNPQAYLQNGQIQLYGTAIQGNFEATAKIVILTGVDQAGTTTSEYNLRRFWTASSSRRITRCHHRGNQGSIYRGIGACRNRLPINHHFSRRRHNDDRRTSEIAFGLYQ